MKYRLLSGCVLMAAFAAGLVLFHLSRPAPPTIKIAKNVHYPITFVAQLEKDPRAGEKIFATYCAACHDNRPIISVNAPRIHHPKDWARFQSFSFDDLLKMAIQGYGAMPMRGGCFECSDQQLKQAIQYMIPSSKHPKHPAHR